MFVKLQALLEEPCMYAKTSFFVDMAGVSNTCLTAFIGDLLFVSDLSIGHLVY